MSEDVSWKDERALKAADFCWAISSWDGMLSFILSLLLLDSRLMNPFLDTVAAAVLGRMDDFFVAGETW